MKKEFNQLVIGLGLGMLALTGCGGGSSVGVSVGSGLYYGSWYDVYGHYCGYGYPVAGCNYYISGISYYPSAGSIYYSNYYYYNDPYSYDYGSYGYASLYSTDETESKDLIGDAAVAQTSLVRKAGTSFAQKHALAEDTGIRIAQTLSDWALLAKNRSRTDADVADFSKRLFGVDASITLSAINKAAAGDTASLELVNRDVATYWGTDPETSKEILKGWFRAQIGNR